ncbi:MAG TPA: response regulator transcription factor [Balneolales bacterium]|nr:response regulator transcription factor [Balneolales bacterium]
MIKIFIADDHPLVREGVKNILLAQNSDYKVVSEAASAGEILEKLRQNHQVDLIILDITLPGRNGLDVLKEIKQYYNQIPVLILSMHPEEQFAVRAMKAGAAGYLAKNSVPDELVNAIRRVVVEKRRFITQAVAEQLADSMEMDTQRPPHEILSDREFQVMCLLAEGKKVKEIAEGLSLSPRTIHTYRARIFKKLNVDSNVELTRYAINHQLVV